MRIAKCETCLGTQVPPEAGFAFRNSQFAWNAPSSTSELLLLQHRHELARLGDLHQALRDVGLLAELGDLAEDGEVLVGDLEGRGDDEEVEVDRLLVDRLEVHALALSAERDAQLVDDERAAVRDRDPSADACRAEVLPALQHLEQ